MGGVEVLMKSAADMVAIQRSSLLKPLSSTITYSYNPWLPPLPCDLRDNVAILPKRYPTARSAAAGVAANEASSICKCAQQLAQSTSR